MSVWTGPNDIETRPLIDNDCNDLVEVLVDNPAGGSHEPEVRRGNRCDGSEVIVVDQHQDLGNLENLTLPEGKYYHLFFSYSSEVADSNFVKERVRILEKPPYNLKCCVDKRDFITGMSIEENINRCMSQSMKIILVLSPSFVESGWCNYEQRIAQALSVADRTYSVIPIMYKPCKIPDSLKILNYIDVDNGDAIDDKVTKSLLAKAGPENILPNGFVNLFGLKDVNGGKVRLSAVPGSTFGYSKLSWVFPQVTPEQCRELREIGFELELENKLDRIRDDVNKHLALRLHGIKPMSKAGCGHSSIIVLAIYLCMVMIEAIVYGVTDASVSTFVVTLLLSSLAFSIFCPCFGACVGRFWKNEAHASVNELLVKYNIDSYRKHNEIFSYTAQPNPQLFVVYYNTQECEKFIQCLIKRKMEEAKQLDVDADKTVVEDAKKAMDTLVKVTAGSFSTWSSLPDATYMRHPTLQHKMCLCQMYQSTWRAL